MTHWEYHVEEVTSAKGLRGALTTFGKQGWELVSAPQEVYEGISEESWTLIFKRPLEVVHA